jgi:hypothetical protein
MKTSLYIFLSLLTLVSCNKTLHNIIVKTNADLPGQTAPSDMIFIPGNDTVPSYYIGVSEEPNINYIQYLKWLQRIYIDYPEKVVEALPHQPSGEETCSFNDPYIKGYLTNPVYAYAPVVNLDWYQINRYLKWKTDMLNEEILIKNDLLSINPDQQGEPFNTEAHLCGQYESGIKNHLISHNPHEGGGRNTKWRRGKWRSGVGITNEKNMGRRNTNPNDGICFLGFRLPTESEWLRAAKPKFKAIYDKVSPKYLNYDFGSDYLSFRYGRMFQTSSDNYSSPLPHPINSYAVDPDFYHDIKNKRTDTTIHFVRDYASDKYGVINMSIGVQEWLLDEYNSEINYDDFISICKKSGFETDSAAVLNPHQLRYRNDSGRTYYVDQYWPFQYTEKDKFGQMESFIFMGFDQNGNPNEISPLPTDSIIRSRVVRGGTSCNPGLDRSSLNEDQWSANVGFRCVLMYTGAPVLNGFKVKWK